jgi:choline dehydrogenase
VDAAVATGLPPNDDFNARCDEGAGLLEVTQRDGRRHSAADAYLAPVRDRDNLDVVTHARATRVRFVGSRAVGVTYRRSDVDVDAAAMEPAAPHGGLPAATTWPADHQRLRHWSAAILPGPRRIC